MEKASCLEEALLLPESCKEEEITASDEVKRQLRLAGPLIAGSLLQNLIQMISVMFVGHLGELPLAGASMASSFAAVTGFSLLVRVTLFCAMAQFCSVSLSSMHSQTKIFVLFDFFCYSSVLDFFYYNGSWY